MTESTFEIVSSAWVDRLSTGELERVWETSFDRLVTTSIAVAEGRVRPEVFNLLRSPKWRDRWYDSLQCALAELETACERMLYTADMRYARTRERVLLLRQATEEALAFLKARDLEEDEKQGAPKTPHASAEQVARRILILHFNPWFQEEMKKAMAQRGLPVAHPTRSHKFSDGIELLEFLVEKGALQFPGEEEAHRLQNLTDDAFRNKVAEDVADQELRNPALRHPIMLNDWMAALQDLQEMTWSALELTGHPRARLPGWTPPPDVKEVEVHVTLRRRRFYRGVIQRKTEWLRLRRTFVRAAVIQEARISQPWTEASECIRASMPEVFPREYAAIRRALDSFGETPGSSVMSDEYRKNRKKVDSAILAALQDGSWTDFLKS